MTLPSTLFPVTVTVKSVSSKDDYGQPTYGSGTSVAAIVVLRTEETFNEKGEATIAKGYLWVEGSESVAVSDQVTYDGTTYRVVGVQIYHDMAGEPFYKKAVLA